MIGKSLNERYSFGALSEATATSIVRSVLADHAAPLVQVRARDARMIACLVVRADDKAVRLCRKLGVEMKRGGSGVVGLLGSDAAQVFALLSPEKKAWLETPCAARETKILLVAGGLACLSLVAEDGKVTLTAVS